MLNVGCSKPVPNTKQQQRHKSNKFVVLWGYCEARYHYYGQSPELGAKNVFESPQKKQNTTMAAGV
jgi:hypothetical protein